MKDDIDTKTDAQISEIFAVEVAGYVKYASYVCPSKDFFVEASRDKEEHPPTIERKSLGFATDANAVIPHIQQFIDKGYWLKVTRVLEVDEDFTKSDHAGYSASLCTVNEFGGSVEFTGFVDMHGEIARGMCVALIRAKRAEKGAES